MVKHRRSQVVFRSSPGTAWVLRWSQETHIEFPVTIGESRQCPSHSCPAPLMIRGNLKQVSYDHQRSPATSWCSKGHPCTQVRGGHSVTALWGISPLCLCQVPHCVVVWLQREYSKGGDKQHPCIT